MTQDTAPSDDTLVDEIPASTPTGGSDISPAVLQLLAELADCGPIMTPDGAINLAPFAELDYLTYALSVVKGRALPHVCDGQKPVQLRILYAMHAMGLDNRAKHIKSARAVGETMGKYHPHGDGAIYDAMVRMAQDFSLRYPLIDGQGNFGSRDGDGAAAMRYTEARLTEIARTLLDELNSGTVDFKPNYNGEFTEPCVLPARLPMVLLNGASGIGVGMATEIPSHNLREVCAAAALVMRNPQATLADIMTHIAAPDFPGGGQLISSLAKIRDIYASGRGSLRMRARWKREDLARGQWRIIVHELPHGVSSAKVLEEIEAATNPEPKEDKKGKKELSTEQQNIKKLMLDLLDEVRDESDGEQPVRLVIEPKTSKVGEDELMGALLAHTSLESSVPVNLVVVGRDGNPRQKNLLEMLQEWVEFRYETVERRCRHRLAKVMDRLHVLDGRMIALLNIDEVLKVIRSAEDPKAKLMQRFKLTERQAEDILEMRLRQLARMEQIKIETEAKELRIEQAHLERMLSDRDYFIGQVIGELEADVQQFGDDRRTLVQPVESMRMPEINVRDEPVTVLVSRNGWLRLRPGHGLDRSNLGWRQDDGERAVLETRSTHHVHLLDDQGRVYSFKASAVPGGRGDGVHLNTLVEIQNKAGIVAVFSGPPDASFLFSNSKSFGFVTQLSNLECRSKTGKDFMTLEAGESVLPPVKIEDANDWVAVTSQGAKESRLLLFPVQEMKNMPKGHGVIMMALDEGESLTVVRVLRGNPPQAVQVHMASGQAVPIRGDDLQRFLLHRNRKGCQLSKRTHAVDLSQ